MLLKELRERELGRNVDKRRERWEWREEHKRTDALQLSRRRQMPRQVDADSVYSLHLNTPEQRFLLCGSSSGSLSVVDLDVPSTSSHIVSCPVVAAVPKNAKYGHRFMVVSCQWYAADSGMFVTASTDKTLKVWDTNVLRPVDNFVFPERLSHQHWSTVPSPNPLIAVAAGTSNVILVDLRSGSSLHQLKWHTDTVNLVQWSSTDANILVTAGADGLVHVWDVRSGRNRLTTLSIASRGTAASQSTRFGQSTSSTKRRPMALVNALHFTADGLFLVVMCSDKVLRFYDARSMRQVHWASMKLPSFCGKKAVALDSFARTARDLTVFVPCEDDIASIKPFRQHKRLLHGHYNGVSACVFRHGQQQLYSCAGDRLLLVWCPQMDEQVSMEDSHGSNKVVQQLQQDQWSDPDD